MSLVKAPIKDFALGIYDGPHATPKEATEGHIFLGIKNVTPEGRLDFSQIKYVSDEEFPKWTRRVTPQAGDVVFSYEATLHRYAVIPEGFDGCLGRRMGLVRPDRTKLLPRYLHYYFLSPVWQRYLETKVITGATVNRLPIKDFPSFLVTVPTLSEQARIVEILSAYDDLIENNRRRIQLLEESARLLYQEWFVHLRFPGHEHVKVVDGVPEGWRNSNIADFASVKSGYAFKSSNWQESGNPVIKIKNIGNNYDVNIDDCQCVNDNIAAKASRFELQTDNLLIAMTGATVGKIGFMPRTNTKYYLNQRTGVFVPVDKDLTLYLFCALAADTSQSMIDNLAAGAAQPNISGKQIESIPLLTPSTTTLNAFIEAVKPAFAQRQTLIEMNGKLAQARDLLLPRLMNGELTP